MFFRLIVSILFIGFSSFVVAAPSIEKNILIDDVYENSLSDTLLPSNVREATKAIWSIRKAGKDGGMVFFISPNLALIALHALNEIKQDVNNNRVYLYQGRRKIYIKRIQRISALHDLALISTPHEAPVDNYLTITTAVPDSTEDMYVIRRFEDHLRVTKKQGTHFSLHNREYGFFTNRYNMQGTSGSPLLNKNGNVNGLIVAGSGNYVNAISNEILIDFLQSMALVSPIFNTQLLPYHSPNSTNIFYDDYDEKTGAFNGVPIGEMFSWEEMQRDKIRPYLIEKAKQGLPEAQMRLYEYDSNQNKPEDEGQQVSSDDYWLREAAKSGHASALLKLAINLKSQDSHKSFQLFNQAKELGEEIRSQSFIADMYLKGEGVSQDIEKALFLYQKLAEEGYAEAQFILAKYYFNDAVPAGGQKASNFDKALFWLQKAVAVGMGEAIHLLARLYDEGANGIIGPVEKDKDRAWLLYALAADTGHNVARMKLSLNSDMPYPPLLPPNLLAENYTRVKKIISDRESKNIEQKTQAPAATNHNSPSTPSKNTEQRRQRGLCRGVISRIGHFFSSKTSK